jgi:hypothetical protein
MTYILNSIDHEKENIRNLAVRVIKILIQRFGHTNTNLLVEPVIEGLF